MGKKIVGRPRPERAWCGLDRQRKDANKCLHSAMKSPLEEEVIRCLKSVEIERKEEERKEERNGPLGYLKPCGRSRDPERRYDGRSGTVDDASGT